MKGIFKLNSIGEREEVPQKDIDFWCGQCQFPFHGACSFDEGSIQQCWDNSTATAHQWHLQHECPFTRKGEECICNSFKSTEEAFQSAGLEYTEGGVACEAKEDEVVFGDRVFTWKWTMNIHKHRCLVLMWRRPTQFSDIRYIRLVTFHWLTPWFTNIGAVIKEEKK